MLKKKTLKTYKLNSSKIVLEKASWNYYAISKYKMLVKAQNEKGTFAFYHDGIIGARLALLP